MLFRRSLAILCFTLSLFGLPLEAAALDGITVVLSEEGGVYAQVADKLRAELAEGATARLTVREVSLLSLKQGDTLPADAGQIWVAVGAGAMQALAQKNPPQPILNVLVPRAAFDKLVRQGGRFGDYRRFSALYLDQPWMRQFALIRLALPKHNRIGILLGADSAELAPPLRAAAKAAGVVAVTEKVESEADLLPALKRLLAESAAILAVPDPAIYNRNTAQAILLTTYRHQAPLFGFSPSYVKAGALAAVYSLPEQIGQQTAEIIRQATDQRLPPPQSPRYFSVGLNLQVARSLGLDMENETTLSNKLKTTPEIEP
jgi:hypothetical protein